MVLVFNLLSSPRQICIGQSQTFRKYVSVFFQTDSSHLFSAPVVKPGTLPNKETGARASGQDSSSALGATKNPYEPSNGNTEQELKLWVLHGPALCVILLYLGRTFRACPGRSLIVGWGETSQVTPRS